MRYILFLLIYFPLFVFCQNEGNIWYFGNGAGLDFNSGSPIVLTNGQLNTSEGCATISDNNGDLLFYTDGMLAYDKNHNIMPNGTGLLGSSTSTQSGIIVKQPGSTTIYYLFSIDAGTVLGGSGGGITYSEVDMSLRGGLGDINANKNIGIVSNATEKITAISHQNGYDFWIITRLEYSNAYHAYLLTSSGLNMNPVITNIGPIHDPEVGYLKGSPDGNKIAVANGYAHTFDVMDFDKQTGVLSNINTYTFLNNTGAYGVEFSPNSQILYGSGYGFNGELYQIDLLTGSTSIIGSSLDIFALQLAPDNKIYIATGTYEIGVIDSPDILGIGCNYSMNALYLGGYLCMYGLPTFFSSIFNSAPDSTFSSETACDIYMWDGIPYTISGLYSRVYTNVAGNDSTHTLDLTINYTESQASVTTECDSYTFNGQTFTTSGTYVGIFTNQVGCDSTHTLGLTINSTSSSSSMLTECDNYIWDGDTITQSGTYTKIFTNNAGCDSIHTLDLTINSTSSSSSIVTECDSYTFNGITFTSSGVYTFSYINQGGCDSTHTLDITINYTDIESSTLTECDSVEWDGVVYTTSGAYTNLYTDVTGCDSTHTLNLTINNSTFSSSTITDCDSYFWPVDNNMYTTSGTYTDISTNNYGCLHTSTLLLSINNSDSSSNHHTICKGASLNVGTNTYNTSGTYIDVLSAINGCDSTVTTYLTVLDQISTFSSLSYPLCVGYSDGSIDINTIGGIPPYSYIWSTGDTTEDITSLPAGAYSLEITDSLGCMYNGVFNLLQPLSLQLSLTSTDTTLTAFASGGNIPYNYQISGPSGFFIVNSGNNGTPYTTGFLISGTYMFTLTDANGCIDSISLYINNSTNSVLDVNNSTKRLIKITDFLGRETKGNKNQPLLYIYDDGTVERRITID